MAVRQYIGARYVPRFRGEWSNTTQYDALDVVDNGAGTSYIARKTVPAGTPLTNTAYWFVYGASSGAIIDLQNRMTQAETNINHIEHKRAILIGDSWGSGLYATHGWIYYLKEMYPFDIAYSDSYGGSGFVATGTGSVDHTFQYLLDNMDAYISDKTSIDTIIVAGGVNDQGLTGVTNAIKSFVDFADVTYPNAKIYICVCNRNITGSQQLSRYNVINDYMAADGYKKKVTVCDMSKCASIDNYVNSLHCNDAGYIQVASAIANMLNGVGFNNGYHELTRSFTHAASGKKITLTFKQLNDGLDVVISGPGSMGAITLTGNIWHSLVFEPDQTPSDAPYPYTDAYIPINLRLETTANNYVPMQGVMTIDGNGVHVEWIRTALSSQAYTDIFIPSILSSMGTCW